MLNTTTMIACSFVSLYTNKFCLYISCYHLTRVPEASILYMCFVEKYASKFSIYLSIIIYNTDMVYGHILFVYLFIYIFCLLVYILYIGF